MSKWERFFCKGKLGNMEQKKLAKFISQAALIQETGAREANAVGYVANVLIQATLPHRNTKETVFKRTNGNLSLSMVALPEIGMPYGTYPRLVLSWITTEAVRTKSPELILGANLSDFMSSLGLIPSGGRWGTIPRLHNQMRRLFSTIINCIFKDDIHSSGYGLSVAEEYELWWDPKMPGQINNWTSTVVLGGGFFKRITTNPVPVDMRAIKVLKDSSMALDLYCWLTHRFSYLRERVEISWESLQYQFGSSYADTKQGRYEFKRKLLVQLKKVMAVYEGASKVGLGEHGLILLPSVPHVAKRKRNLVVEINQT